jgi:signal transduction histidine kinase/ActR/RegA family two-component response regulator
MSNDRETQEDGPPSVVISTPGSRLEDFLESERFVLLARERKARRTAEANAARLAHLQAIAAALGEALTVTDVGDIVVRNVVDAFGARTASLFTPTDGQDPRVVAAHDHGDDALEAFPRDKGSEELVRTHCIDGGEPLFLESQRDLTERFGEGASWNGALACVPLRQNDRTMGALEVAFSSARVFSPEDRTLLQGVGDLCAQAMHRAELYEAERSAKDQALAANRMKDEFLATLSHELRTPLQSILGWSRLLRTGLDLATIPQAISSIERNAQAQARLIGDILDVSRIVTGRLRLRPRLTRVDGFVNAAVDTLRPAAQAKSIHLACTFDGAPESLVGDPDRLQQVVWNLVANAVKFTPANGRVAVHVEDGSGAVRLRVEDTGVGIPPEFMPFVFDRFRQASGGTKRAHGGLGLGLAIAKHLVELHGGTIAAESRDDPRGATFTVVLPVRALAPSPADAADDEPSVSDLSAAVDPAVRLDGISVLVVDDHDDAREMLAAALAKYGAHTTVAASAEEALAALHASPPDVLVSDIGMPGADGYELLRLARLAWREGGSPEIPAIALTAYAREVERTRALDAGFELHLSKPIEPHKLARSVLALTRRTRAAAHEEVGPAEEDGIG